MFAYVLESNDFCKVGVSVEVEKRFYTHSLNFEILRSKTFEMSGENDISKAMFIESYVMNKFNSPTEYLHYQDFDCVCSAVEEAMENIPDKTFHLSLIGVDFVFNKDGYIDMSNVISFASDYCKSFGEKPIRFDNYLANDSTKEFLSVIEGKHSVKPVIGKVGKYGGTYALPYIVLDFLAWANSSLKVKVYSYMFSDSEYMSFMSIMPFYSAKCRVM